MRNFVLAGVLAAAAGVVAPATASAQYTTVIGTRGVDPSNPYSHGYYSPLPGVMYSPFASPPPIRPGFGSYYGPSYYGGGFVSPSYYGPMYYGTGSAVLRPSHFTPAFGGYRRR